MDERPSRLSQYFGEQNEDAHPDHLHWSAATKLPVAAPAGSIGLVKAEELKNYIRLTTYHCQWFNLADPADLAKYTEVMERVANKWYILRYQQRFEFPDATPPKVMTWIEWMQQYEAPPPKQGRTLQHAQRR